jgi:tetratricopeptide (TPR) repeat protein
MLRGALSLLVLIRLAGAQALSPGFEAFYNLDYDTSVAVFEREVQRQPDDPARYNHLAQAILYREMYLAGALESELVTGNNPFLRRAKLDQHPEALRRFDEAIARSMALSEKRIQNNPRDVDALYANCVAYGFRANFNFLVRKAWIDALRDATTSRKLCDKVLALNPGFTDARLVQGVHDYVVGSLSFGYRVLGFLAGFSGDRERGIRTVERVAREGKSNRLDAQILLGVVYRRERRPQDAVPIVLELVRQFPRNHLFRLELVQMYADLGDKEKAVAVLNEMDRWKRAQAPGYEKVPWERLWYARGNLQFWYRDYDAAVENLTRVTRNLSAVDLNTASMAWLRLGQTYEMKKDRTRAVAAYRKALETAPDSDAAREARAYISRPFVRTDE